MSDVNAQTSVANETPEAIPLLHISAWYFGLIQALLQFLQEKNVIDQYDLDEMLRFYATLVPQFNGPDRYRMHYRLYDEPPSGRFSVEDHVVGTSYDYKHMVRDQALEAATMLSHRPWPVTDQ